jgi:demethylspheroidene O-methyltransferase
VAQRRARALFDLCAGFVYSQVLFACVRLGLLELLADGPRSLDAIAERLDLKPEAARRLLDAAASLGLAESLGRERFGLGVLGAAMQGNPGIAAMVEHHALLYADLADPVALLRGERPASLQGYWSYARADAPDALGDEQVAAYSALMSASQSLVAEQILDAYTISGHTCLMDVGGGEGAFLMAAGKRSKQLRLRLFDLPSVAARARARLDAAGLGERCEVFGGDFGSDALPEGADLVSLVRVVHDHDDAAALSLLRAVREILPENGELLLAEPMAGTRGAEPVGHAYFGFYLLAMGSGRARRPEELERLLRSAGFGHTRQIRTRMPLQTGLIVARP